MRSNNENVKAHFQVQKYFCINIIQLFVNLASLVSSKWKKPRESVCIVQTFSGIIVIFCVTFKNK